VRLRDNRGGSLLSSHLWCAGCRVRAENGGGTVPVRPCLSVRLLSPVPLSGCFFLLVCPFPLGRAHARVFSPCCRRDKGMFSLKKSLRFALLVGVFPLGGHTNE
jgi:hypothetical protein